MTVVVPLPPVPNVVQIRITNEGNDGRMAQNVLYWVYGGGLPSSTDCIGFASDVWTAWTTQFTHLQPAQTSLTKVEVTDLSSATAGQGEYDNGGTPVPGTSTHGMLPLHTCVLVSKEITARYRGGRPRSYLAIGTTADLNDDGDWLSASVTAFQTSYVNFVDDLVGAVQGSTTLAEECSVSYYGGAPTVDGRSVRREVPVVHDITVDGYTVSPKLATQRKRVRRVERRR